MSEPKPRGVGGSGAQLDDSGGIPYPKVMEVHFTPELQAKLDRAASDIHRGADEYVQQLVEQYLDHDVWFRQKVEGSLEQPIRGSRRWPPAK